MAVKWHLWRHGQEEAIGTGTKREMVALMQAQNDGATCTVSTKPIKPEEEAHAGA